MRQALPGSAWDRVPMAALAAFLLGYYVLPSTEAHGSASHDLLYYLGAMPAFLALRGRRTLRDALRHPTLVAALAFVAALSLGALSVRYTQEIGRTQALLHGVGTATFVLASFAVLRDGARLATERLLVAAGGVMAAVSLAAWGAGRSYQGGGRLHGALHYEHPNLYAHGAGVAALVALARAMDGRERRGSRAAAAGALVLLLVSMVAAGGRTSLVAVGVAAVVAILHGGRRTGALVALAVATGMAVTLGGEDLLRDAVKRGDAGRWVVYRELARRVDGHWLFGLGLTASDDVAFPAGSGDFPGGFTMPHAHSAVVSAYYHGGAVALVLLAATVLLSFRDAIRLAARARDALPLALLTFGTLCLIPDGHRLVSRPHLSSWLLLWLPLGMAAAGARASLPAAAPSPLPATWGDAGPGRRAALVLGALLLLLRLPHLGPHIDEPHMWRQCDTAQYIRTFLEEGIDLMRPSVCWMGDHRTVILELPLPEAGAALLQRVAGPSLLVSRLWFLSCFAGSALFLVLFLRLLLPGSVARLATLVYMVAPLSLFYSRAIHIDFSVQMLAHAMAFAAAEGMRRRSPRWLAAAAALGTLALLVKAPYAMPLLPPLAVLAWRHRPARLRPAAALSLLLLVVLPLLAFLAWQRHVAAVNGGAPDWSFIPHYRKLAGSFRWYFGSVAQRLDAGNWAVIASRVAREVVGGLGLVPAALGAVVLWRRRAFEVLAWGAGACLHTLVFFNLSLHHDYYQIPFIAPSAALVAVGLVVLAEGAGVARRPAAIAVSGAFLLLAAEHVARAERTYYRVEAHYRRAGEILDARTPPGSLLAVAADGLDCRSPHVLYHAHRYGWSVGTVDLRADLVERFRALGARHLAILTARGEPWDAVPALRPLLVEEYDAGGGHRLYLLALGPEGSAR